MVSAMNDLGSPARDGCGRRAWVVSVTALMRSIIAAMLRLAKVSGYARSDGDAKIREPGPR